MMRLCLGEPQARQEATKIDEIIDCKVETIVMRGNISIMGKMKYRLEPPG